MGSLRVILEWARGWLPGTGGAVTHSGEVGEALGAAAPAATARGPLSAAAAAAAAAAVPRRPQRPRIPLPHSEPPLAIPLDEGI